MIKKEPAIYSRAFQLASEVTYGKRQLSGKALQTVLIMIFK